EGGIALTQAAQQIANGDYAGAMGTAEDFGGALAGGIIGSEIGAGVGAVIGGIVGSIIPGPGTAAGAVIGTELGSLVGSIVGGYFGAQEGHSLVQGLKDYNQGVVDWFKSWFKGDDQQNNAPQPD